MATLLQASENKNLLGAICLTENQLPGGNIQLRESVGSKHMRLAGALLDSYERQVHTVEGALKEMEENLDDARYFLNCLARKLNGPPRSIWTKYVFRRNSLLVLIFSGCMKSEANHNFLFVLL